MITTNNKKLANKLKLYKMFGKNSEEFVQLGTNYKLSDILSSIGLAQLNKIEKIIHNRIKKAKVYDELVSKIDFLEVQQATKNSRHTYQSYVCSFTKGGLRDKVRKKLAQQNIESQIGTYALHCLPAFKNCKRTTSLKNSEFLYKNAISLPLHEELTNEDQQRICKIIKNNLK